jgi:hypothetical protein
VAAVTVVAAMPAVTTVAVAMVTITVMGRMETAVSS